MVNVCHSGGASGADDWWAVEARKCGHLVRAYSFEGHQFIGDKRSRIVLDDFALGEAMQYVRRANLQLGRLYNISEEYTTKLLCRNWYEVRDTNSLYAVGRFAESVIDGGTAWACQMFLNKYNGDPCEAYFYDLELKVWRKWNGRLWDPIRGLVPTPHGQYTGVGTRECGAIGRRAITALYGLPLFTP